MSVFDLDIDKQIKQYQQKIQELEQQRVAYEQKLEGFKKFDVAITQLCQENSLTEYELYVSRSERIEEWIINMAKQENPSSIYLNLRRHFSRIVPRSVKVKDSSESSLPKPKLEVGTYRNPATHEKVEKIKRNPRLLDEWIEQYGFATVRTWKV